MTSANNEKGLRAGLARDQSRVLSALDRVHSLERDISERLIRVEENLRLLRQDLLGNGQPGRMSRLEIDLHQLRTESLQQRGILAGISFIVSMAITLLSQFLFG